MIILAKILNNEQLKKVEFTDNTILTLLKIINKSIEEGKQNENNNYSFTFTIKGYTNVIDLTDCLKCLLRILSSNEDIKNQINILNDALETIFNVIKEDIKLFDQFLCADILLILSNLNNDIENSINKNEKAIKLVKNRQKIQRLIDA